MDGWMDGWMYRWILNTTNKNDTFSSPISMTVSAKNIEVHKVQLFYNKSINQFNLSILQCSQIACWKMRIDFSSWWSVAEE